ncbi:MAG: methyltransferase domain-containing protein [Planctomycetota bacterium]|nr:MAG: methyltransferase domain-containing protein [Planctomycetota bacterium]
MVSAQPSKSAIKTKRKARRPMLELETRELPGVIPLPPLELRKIVGPTEPEDFDNPGGTPIYEEFGFPEASYEAVFDFGCGCGRLARQLLQQNPRPRRYVGIDVHQGMIDWCKRSLSPLDANFQFFHHDVYSPTAAAGNSMRLAEPFPAQDGGFSLVIAHSVFTHLFKRQTEYYLKEASRILRPSGRAFTTWFFFDNDSFPFFDQGPHCLFAGETDPTHAVIYDRGWFLNYARACGLRVVQTIPPRMAGHQWIVILEKRLGESVDRFPLGAEGAEWLCGATLKPIATPTLSAEYIARNKVRCLDSRDLSVPSDPPPLFGVLAELQATKDRLAAALNQLETTKQVLARAEAELERIRRSRSWKLVQAGVRPIRMLRNILPGFAQKKVSGTLQPQ